jgi:hypothetical protein
MKRKRKLKSRKGHRKSHWPQPSNKARKKLRGFITSSWSIIVGISVLMTIIGTIYAFSTRVSISSDVTLDPSDPFRTPFVISNDSYLPISDVTFSCKASNIQPNEFVDAFPPDQEGRVPRLGEWSLKPGPRYVADYLQPNEKRSFECLSIIGLLKHPITNASVEIFITYRPLWILWKQERQFKFDTQRNKDGQLVWLPPRHY